MIKNCCMISTWKMSLLGMKRAAPLLKRNVPVHEAILMAVKTVEDDPAISSVGYGGLPNLNGEVELDAAYMNGDTLGFGGVMSVKNIKNPIEVAFDLSHYQRNCLLSDIGATRYAQSKGFAFQNMFSPESKKRYDQTDKMRDSEMLEAYKEHDTVCVIGMDHRRSMACGVSTSGLFLKMPGRVGDSPIIGSGLYADSEVGCAAATGVGEDIMKGCLSFSIVEKMRNGMDPQTACETALQQHLQRFLRCNHSSPSSQWTAMEMRELPPHYPLSRSLSPIKIFPPSFMLLPTLVEKSPSFSRIRVGLTAIAATNRSVKPSRGTFLLYLLFFSFFCSMF